MKHSAEHSRFTNLVDRVLAVPHSVIKKRVDEQRERAAKNPNKRGPKRKAKPFASSRASSNRK